MANWITHTIVADILFERYSNLDERAFCIGNVAPDCNMPRGKDFIPSREITHFMDGDDKLSARYDLFFEKYISGRSFSSNEEYSFLLGYYAHLITDVEYMRFCRDEKQLSRMFSRIRKNSKMAEMIAGGEENFMTLRNAFGKTRIFFDIISMENEYLKTNPDCSYNRILRNIDFFPNYLDIFTENHYAEKISMMLAEYDRTSDIAENGFLFFTKEEYEGYLLHTSEIIFESLVQKIPIPI